MVAAGVQAGDSRRRQRRRRMLRRRVGGCGECLYAFSNRDGRTLTPFSIPDPWGRLAACSSRRALWESVQLYLCLDRWSKQMDSWSRQEEMQRQSSPAFGAACCVLHCMALMACCLQRCSWCQLQH